MAPPNGQGSLAAAVKDAFEGDDAEVASDEATDSTESEGTDETDASSAASAEGQDDAAQEGGADEAETPDDTEGTAEIPDDYFGFDLSPYTPEQREAIVAQLEKRDDFIGKLLRDDAAPEGEQPKDEAEPVSTDLSDDAIIEALKGLGLDPEDPSSEPVFQGLIPVVRKQVEQDQKLASLYETIELQELDRSWRSSLSGLEKEYGSLPAKVTHDRVMEFAAENGIANAYDAYWRIVGPARSALEQAGKAHRSSPAEAKAALAAKKKAAASTRPSATDSDADAALESKDAKGATKEVALRLLKQMGIG